MRLGRDHAALSPDPFAGPRVDGGFYRGLALALALTLVFFWAPLAYVLWQVLA